MNKRQFVILLAFASAWLASGCAEVDVDSDSTCVASFAGPEVSGQELAIKDVNTTLYAESFTLDESSTPGTVKLKLKAIGTPTGDLVVTLHANSSGNPAVIQTEPATLDASTITPGAAAAYYTFTFDTPAKTLAAGTYWIVLHGNSSFNSTTGVSWMVSNRAGAYPDGSALNSGNNGSTWTTSLVDSKAFLFLVGC
jgi:hypothetical protein